MQVDTQYESLVREIFNNGRVKTDRTGTGTISVFGRELRYDLLKGFPLVTTKKVHLRSIIVELLWFLRGESNVKWLQENGCTIWDEWAREDGDLGPVYGVQWRNWKGKVKNIDATPIGLSEPDKTQMNMVATLDYEFHDQVAEVIKLLTETPDSRRIIVSAWNVADLKQMALMPCHVMWQCYSEELSPEEHEAYCRAGYYTLGPAMRKLSLKIVQRSADMFLGVPFNIASYAALTHMLAAQTNHVPGDLIWSGGDCHIYSNHVEQVKLQLSRQEAAYPFPTLKLCSASDIYSYTVDDFNVHNYQHHPAIKAPVAV